VKRLAVAGSAIATALCHHTHIYIAALLHRSSINSVLHFPSPTIREIGTYNGGIINGLCAVCASYGLLRREIMLCVAYQSSV
jgi:hypothetical protein